MIARALVLLIRVYRRLLSPLVGPVCRFEPSCSAYAQQCLEMHGAFKGSLLSLIRLCKCHPLHPGGYDPPPLPKNAAASPVSPSSPSPADAVRLNHEPMTRVAESAPR
jgi:uncharacterized protein